MGMRMFPDKNDGEMGILPIILCILGIVFPPIGIILLIVAFMGDWK